MPVDRRAIRAAWWLLAAVGLAALTADLLGRQLGLGALGGGTPAQGIPGAEPDALESGGGRLALTFDDGPSPQLPALLALLARYGVQATFFLTGERAEADPAAVQALRAAGHQLESHGYRHRHALTLTPWAEARQLGWHPEAGAVQGGRGLLYRPPWGGHSVLTRLLARRAGVRIALWSAESRDWLPRDGARLARELLPQLQDGAVVLLHDGPAAERSARTLALLEVLLPALQQRGLSPVTLGRLGPGPIGLRTGWVRLLGMYRQLGSRSAG